jgi:hypothetical protein
VFTKSEEVKNGGWRMISPRAADGVGASDMASPARDGLWTVDARSAQVRRQLHGHSPTSSTHARRLFLLSDVHFTPTTPATLLPLPSLCLLEPL